MYLHGKKVVFIGSDDHSMLVTQHYCLSCGYHVQGDSNLKPIPGGCGGCGKQFYRCPRCGGSMRSKKIHIPNPSDQTQDASKAKLPAKPVQQNLPRPKDVLRPPSSTSHIVRSVHRNDRGGS